MKIKEATRIRLKGFNASNNAEDFLEDFLDLSEEHPFHPRARVVGGATVEVSRQGRNIRLNDITTLDPQKGHASKALRLLQKLAKEHNVQLNLTAKAYRDDMMNTQQLVAWYQKMGFEIEPGQDEIDVDNGVDMHYIP